MFKNQQSSVSNVTVHILLSLAQYKIKKKAVKNAFLPQPQLLRPKVWTSHLKVCQMLSFVWFHQLMHEHLSPTRQLRNQCKQTLLAAAPSWKAVVYHKSSLATEVCQSLSVLFWLATALRRKRSSHGTLKPTRFQVSIQYVPGIEVTPQCVSIPRKLFKSAFQETLGNMSPVPKFSPSGHNPGPAQMCSCAWAQGTPSLVMSEEKTFIW